VLSIDPPRYLGSFFGETAATGRGRFRGNVFALQQGCKAASLLQSLLGILEQQCAKLAEGIAPLAHLPGLQAITKRRRNDDAYHWSLFGHTEVGKSEK
jgi:hypothetical protein